MTTREARHTRPAANGNGSRRKTRVLLVEDNVDGREALEALLSFWDFEVMTAEDGMQALELAQSEAPEVAILDIGLPKLDGYEVARRLRTAMNGHGPRLIALTGYGQPEDRHRALEAGFDLHLVKPVNPAELHRILSNL